MRAQGYEVLQQRWCPLVRTPTGEPFTCIGTWCYNFSDKIDDNDSTPEIPAVVICYQQNSLHKSWNEGVVEVAVERSQAQYLKVFYGRCFLRCPGVIKAYF